MFACLPKQCEYKLSQSFLPWSLQPNLHAYHVVVGKSLPGSGSQTWWWSSCVFRAAVRVLQIEGDRASQSRPEVPAKTPDGLSISLFPVGCTIEVFPFVGE